MTEFYAHTHPDKPWQKILDHLKSVEDFVITGDEIRRRRADDAKREFMEERAGGVK
ncbi:MAG: hypothetical protein V1809_16210 [Planctomycetota bacterium]